MSIEDQFGSRIRYFQLFQHLLPFFLRRWLELLSEISSIANRTVQSHLDHRALSSLRRLGLLGLLRHLNRTGKHLLFELLSWWLLPLRKIALIVKDYLLALRRPWFLPSIIALRMGLPLPLCLFVVPQPSDVFLAVGMHALFSIFLRQIPGLRLVALFFLFISLGPFLELSIWALLRKFSQGLVSGRKDVGLVVEVRNRHQGIILQRRCLFIVSERIEEGLVLNLPHEIADCLLLFLHDEAWEVFVEEGVGGGSGEGGKQDGLDYVVFYEV